MGRTPLLCDILDSAQQLERLTTFIPLEGRLSGHPTDTARGSDDAIVNRSDRRTVLARLFRRFAPAVVGMEHLFEIARMIAADGRHVENPAKFCRDLDISRFDIEFEGADAPGFLRCQRCANAIAHHRVDLFLTLKEFALAVCCSAKFQMSGNLSGESLQYKALLLRQALRARHVVDNAERAYRDAIR